MSNSTTTNTESHDELSRISTVTIIMVSITFMTFLIYLFSRFEFERGRIVILDTKTSVRIFFLILISHSLKSSIIYT